MDSCPAWGSYVQMNNVQLGFDILLLKRELFSNPYPREKTDPKSTKSFEVLTWIYNIIKIFV